MLLIALVVSFVTFLACASQLESRTDTLANWYESESEKIVKSQTPLNQLLNSASRECVEEKIELNALGSNTYDDDDFVSIFVIKAFELCVANQDELWRMRADEYLQELRYGWYNEEESIECLKAKIRESEPYATILDGDNHDDKKDCSVEPQLEWSHDLLTEKASPFPCFVRSRNDVKYDNIFYKLRIIEFGDLSEERRRSEMENIGRQLRRMAEMNHRCLRRHLE